MKHLKLHSWILTALLPLMSTAQKQLKTPLTFVPADSVVIWGESYNDLRGMALQVDKNLAAHSIQPLGKSYKASLKAWKKNLLPALAVSGLHPEKESDELTLRNAQTVEQAASLLLETADSHFADVAERIIWGDLLREVLSPAPASFSKHTAAQALVDATGTILATSGEDVWVNLFTNSTTHVKTDHLNVIVDLMTGMPLEGRVKIRLTGYSRGRFHVRLHIRIPGWAIGDFLPRKKFALVEPQGGKWPQCPTFFINGRESLTSDMEKGYFIIDRTWNTGDEVLFDLPIQPYFVREQVAKKQPSAIYHLYRGPLLYAPKDQISALNLTPQTHLEDTENEDGVVCFKTTSREGREMLLVPYITTGK